uniref:GAG-pre-integrase domain-containing protein n=1 Tax=Tanacetum cinerariifolium TaxID=118510 RepID=A0A6L2KBI3_TANCI|nr:hypothetical protein [Tanacetum cinerariifolium]
MPGNRKLFSTYKAYNGGNIICGSNLRCNIISKGQICDNKCRVTFSKHDSEFTKDGKVIGRGMRKKGLYVMKLRNKPKDQICLETTDENSTLWHRRLGHTNMHVIQSLACKELVRSLPKLKFDQKFCDACKIEKQTHASHKAKNIVSATRCLELLHMDYEGNRYTLVIVDDYSRKIKESLNVTFDESPPPSKTSPLVDDELDEEEAIKVIKKKILENDVEDETLEIDEVVNIKETRNHPLENVIGNLSQRTLRCHHHTSPTTTSLSPTPSNALSKTSSTNQTSSSQENSSFSFQSKLQISPPSSNEPTSPQPLNPLLENISDVPPRPLNPQPLRSHPSLDITHSLSLITPFDHIHNTPSPPSPPQPQPPIMGHLFYHNYHDYHGLTFICYFYNQTLFLTLSDEMNIMFAHLEYLLTTAITSHFSPPP